MTRHKVKVAGYVRMRRKGRSLLVTQVAPYQRSKPRKETTMEADPLVDPAGHRHELYLGDGHWLDWFISQEGGSATGAIISHTQPSAEDGVCAGAVYWGPVAGRPIWALEGQPDEHLTLSPSVACKCGDHGWIRDGKWVPA